MIMAEQIYREETGSGIVLGPFDQDGFYNIENSKDVRISRKEHLKSVECVVIRNDELLLIEAKKTAPKELSAERKKSDWLK
jgi:hypothetical protein